MSAPLERIVVDLTYLPDFLLKNTNYKYLLNIADHFSKYLTSYLIKKKEGKSIADKLNTYFKKFGIPQQLGSDNGTEFVNKNVQKLLKSKDIIWVKGKPYNPHSQGVVERVHRTIRTGLICKYLENKSSFDLKLSLNEVVETYNNCIHRTTKKNHLKYFYQKIENYSKRLQKIH